MKILAFVDLHGSERAFKILKEKAKKVDIILCCGDMTVFGMHLEKIMKNIAGLKKPVYVIPGNHEEGSPLQAVCKKHKNLIYADKRLFKKGEIAIVAHGGGGFSFTSPSFDTMMKKVKPHLGKINILMTHQPPYKTALSLLYLHTHSLFCVRAYLVCLWVLICLALPRTSTT